jgi:hypothetical protein
MPVPELLDLDLSAVCGPNVEGAEQRVLQSAVATAKFSSPSVK